MSHLEREFAFQLRAAKLAEPELQRIVHASHRWRFDFAWPAHKLAVEIEGGFGWKPLKSKTGRPIIGHHAHRKGYLSDCRKYNLAVAMGWRVLRFTGAQVTRGEALLWTELLLSGKTIPYDGPTRRKGTARKSSAALQTPNRRGSRGGSETHPRGGHGESRVEGEQVGAPRDLRAELAHAQRAARSGEAGAAADQSRGQEGRAAGGAHADGARQLHGADR